MGEMAEWYPEGWEEGWGEDPYGLRDCPDEEVCEVCGEALDGDEMDPACISGLHGRIIE